MWRIKIFFILLLLLIVFFAKSGENIPTLKAIVSEILKGAKGNYAVFIKNLKTEEKYVFNENLNFESGSLYKLWLMTAVFEKIQKNELKEDQILTSDIQSLNQKFQIQEESAELTTGTISLSVKSALEQMITISHNYAAYLLTEKVEKEDIPVKITAEDVGLFFEKLYKGKLADKKYSQEMIEILKKQKLNNGLPKNLPKDVVIAHKTGDIGQFKHDAGIVYAEYGDYIIVVLSESDLPSGAQERIANISKEVYNYFREKEK